MARALRAEAKEPVTANAVVRRKLRRVVGCIGSLVVGREGRGDRDAAPDHSAALLPPPPAGREKRPARPRSLRGSVLQFGKCFVHLTVELAVTPGIAQRRRALEGPLDPRTFVE